MNAGAWARARGVDGRSLHAWQMNIARRGATVVKSNPVALLPVRVSGTTTRQVELEFGVGLRLRFEEGCDPAYVAAVVCRLR